MRKEAIAFVDKSGKPTLRMANKSQFQLELGDFDEGAKVWVIVETFRDIRTLPQNARMHVYFDKIAKFTGQDKKTVKEVLKFKFLMRTFKDKDGQEVVDEDTGEVMQYVASTRSLDTLEADQFLSEIKMWALELFNLDVDLRV